MEYYKILGYYPTKAGYKSIANMEKSRKNSQPDIDSSEKTTSFYSSNYGTSNYSSLYPSNTSSAVVEAKDADTSNWLNSKNYAMVPRMGRRASQEYSSKYYKRDNSRSNKKDYQDIYKDKKDSKSKLQADSTRRTSIDSGSVVTSIPSIPTRKYSKDEDYATYEDLAEESSPPKLMPLSGFLSQNAGRAVVRPIAFKPVVKSSSNSYSSHSPETYTYEKPHIDDGYVSQESRSCSHNGTMRDCYIYETPLDSFESSHPREQKVPECYQVTPSPTDIGAAHYEQRLLEKEKELTILRQTMETNEKAIFQVNEERRINWESQMKDVTTEYHRRLRLQQDRAAKVEKEMQTQIEKLKQDNQRLSSEREQLLSLKDNNFQAQEQLKSLHLRNDELSSQLTGLTREKELIRAKEQGKIEQVQNLEELVTVIKAENMNLNNELDEKCRILKKYEKQQEPGNEETQKLEKMLTEQSLAIEAERDQFNHDRELWEQEKKKVLQYQKQLQSNYIQMCRRNSELEGYISQGRPLNNNFTVEKQTPYRHLKPQEKTSFKAQLESTPESLC